MAAVANSLLLASNSPIQLSSGSSFNSSDQSIRALCSPTLSIAPNSSRKAGYKRLVVHAGYSDDRRDGSSSVFIGGFILGGLVVGTLGCVYAPQISKALSGTDRKDLMRKLPKFIYDEEKALERTRKILTEKIAQLNSAIDDVSSQLRTDGAPNGAAVNSDEMEATI